MKTQQLPWSKGGKKSLLKQPQRLRNNTQYWIIFNGLVRQNGCQDIMWKRPNIFLTKFAITIVSNIVGFLWVPRVNWSPRGGCLVSKSEQWPEIWILQVNTFLMFADCTIYLSPCQWEFSNVSYITWNSLASVLVLIQQMRLLRYRLRCTKFELQSSIISNSSHCKS